MERDAARVGEAAHELLRDGRARALHHRVDVVARLGGAHLLGGVERLELSHRTATATACASSRECVIERSTEPTPSAAARSASRPESRTAGFGRPTISISFHANARATPKPSALPTASLPAKRPA